jgi:excinuclease ABC subunit C
MKEFGSLKRLRAASVEELMAVPGIGRRTAEAVQAAIAEPGEGSEERPAGTDPLMRQAVPVEDSTIAPQGRAERGTPREGTGDTPEVGLVAS